MQHNVNKNDTIDNEDFMSQVYKKWEFSMCLRTFTMKSPNRPCKGKRAQDWGERSFDNNHSKRFREKL